MSKTPDCTANPSARKSTRFRRETDSVRFFFALMTIVLQNGCGSPDLSRSQAASIISRTPEFNQSRTLVTVTSTTRCADSMAEVCYTVKFQFRSGPNIVEASSQFGYWAHRWHMTSFDYGNPPNIETVTIKSDPRPLPP